MEGKSPTSSIRDIITREADKGGKNFVIHKKACESQLQNEPFYKKIDKDIYHKITITEKVNELFIDELITKKELSFLSENCHHQKHRYYMDCQQCSRLCYQCEPFSLALSLVHSVFRIYWFFFMWETLMLWH